MLAGLAGNGRCTAAPPCLRRSHLPPPAAVACCRGLLIWRRWRLPMFFEVKLCDRASHGQGAHQDRAYPGGSVLQVLLRLDGLKAEKKQARPPPGFCLPHAPSWAPPLPQWPRPELWYLWCLLPILAAQGSSERAGGWCCPVCPCRMRASQVQRSTGSPPAPLPPSAASRPATAGRCPSHVPSHTDLPLGSPPLFAPQSSWRRGRALGRWLPRSSLGCWSRWAWWRSPSGWSTST